MVPCSLGGMARGTIYDEAEKFRAALLAEDRAAIGRLVQAYGESWQRIDRELQRLLAALARKAAEGRTPIVPPVAGGRSAEDLGRYYSRALQYEQARLEALRRAVEAELRRVGPLADLTIQQANRTALAMASEHAPALMRLAVGGARTVAGFVNPNLDPLVAQVSHLVPGSPLRALLDAMPAQTGQAMSQALQEGLALGRNPRVVAQEVKRAWGGSLYRHTLIARTEMLRSYREASHLHYESNSDVLDGWVWHCGLDMRTCAACWARHGTVHPLGERLQDHPHGRCSPVPIVRGRPDLIPLDGEVLFDRLSQARQREILGPSKHALYEQGAIALPDMVKVTPNAEWGSHVGEASRAQALANARRRRRRLAAQA